jgi:hypothetical protein
MLGLNEQEQRKSLSEKFAAALSRNGKNTRPENDENEIFLDRKTNWEIYGRK